MSATSPPAAKRKREVDFIDVFSYNAHMSITYNPKKKKRATTHGFLVRMATKGGKKVIARRRSQGRKKLSV